MPVTLCAPNNGHMQDLERDASKTFGGDLTQPQGLFFSPDQVELRARPLAPPLEQVGVSIQS